MNFRLHAIWILAAVCLLVLVIPVQADTTNEQDVNVIYQASFSSDPGWKTITPSTNYWEPGAGRYRFTIDPSTGGYSYISLDKYKDTSFNLDYDLVLTRIDDNAKFRMAISSNEMNPEKGPAVVTEFTNAKFGKIMWLTVVTPGNKITKVNSQSGNTAYTGSTVKFELNKTYHVSVDYNKDTNIVTMKVAEKQSGQEIWSYFVKNTDDLNGMARLWLGSIGDYGGGYIAQGYIDNVQMTVPVQITSPTVAAVIPDATAPAATPTKKPTPKTTVPTPYPTSTTQSPLSPLTAVGALGIIGGCLLLSRKKE